MRNRLVILTAAILTAACGPTDYSWQSNRAPKQPVASTSAPAPADQTSDLEYCQSYAAKQYQAGKPKGSEYLEEYQGYPHGYAPGGSAADEPDQEQEWHPDRNPTGRINNRQMSTHDIPVEHTGYPGYYDYSPNYLDDIFEKCMRDRGWEYLPTTESQQE